MAAVDRMTPDLALADRLFADLRAATQQGEGIVRDSFGAGEQVAHDLAAAAARAAGLDVETDAAGNLYMILRGRTGGQRVVVGSHLDSVPQGGNYDGAAGVVAGLAVAAGLRAAGRRLEPDLAVMAIRAEESVWFNSPYVGSKGAFGLLDATALATPRSDNGRSLASHMEAIGLDPEAVLRGEARLSRETVAAYFEVHIEQGPLLVERRLPAAVVTAVRGCLRYRNARCYGAYGHSGALPRFARADAVAATVALLHAIEAEWLRLEAEGVDLVFTVGEFSTDPALDGPSRVAGETRFVLDIRSSDDAVMRTMQATVERLAVEVGTAYRVRFALGDAAWSPAAAMDPALRRGLVETASLLGQDPYEMASGAGHDAVIFAAQGIPTAMIFIRNDHGSHNPREAMDAADFATATTLLGSFLVRRFGASE